MTMTVICPSCGASFPVDPAKIPAGGVKARCSKCQGIIDVQPPAPEVTAVPEVPAAVPVTPDTVQDSGAESTTVVQTPVVEDAPVVGDPEPAPEFSAPAGLSDGGAVAGTSGLGEGEISFDAPTPDAVVPTPEPSAADSAFAAVLPETPVDEPTVGEASPMEEALGAVPTPPEAPVGVEPSSTPDPTALEPSVPSVPEVPPAPPQASAAALVMDLPTPEAPATTPVPETPADAPVVATPVQFGRRTPEDKAKSLARSLVSDIIAYNTDKHQEAKTAGTLLQVFEEEVEKCLKEYQEQVDPGVVQNNTFFNDALNDILADGESVFNMPG